jgi:hypothetical protein
MRIIASGLFLICFVFQIYAQQQPVDASFTEKVFYSDFTDSDKNVWPLANNQFYFFLIQKSQYVLECKSSDKKAYLLPKGAPSLSTFRLQTEVSIDKDVKGDGSFGIALNVRNNAGYVIELNRDKKFRVRQLIPGNNPKYLTGSEKKEGWESYESSRSKNIRLVVSQKNGTAEVLINNKTRFSFSSAAQGQSGLFIEGIIKATVNDFAMLAPAGESAGEQMAGDDSLKAGDDLNKLTDAIVDCRKKNKELATNYENTKLELSQVKKKLEDLQAYVKDNLDVKLQAELEKTQKQNEQLQSENAGLKQQNTDLSAFKKEIEKNKDGDQVLLYAEKYQAEQKKNEALQQQLKKLQEENKALKTPKSKRR